jgi:antitoxin component of RelBE/YafQ-DinJ toxin-antitoxin module
MAKRDKYIMVRVSDDEKRRYMSALESNGRELSSEIRTFLERMTKRAEK